MKDQTELAPCPFCGGKAMENKSGEIQCSVARCWSSDSMPIDIWNSRHDLRRIKELEESLRYVLEISNGQASRIKELEENVKDQT